MARVKLELKGGGKLEKQLTAMAAQLGNGSAVRVGFLESATYPDGTPVAQVAMWQEFGTTRIPPRPFFRNMITNRSGSWGKALAKVAKSTGYDSRKTMALMGEGIKGQLQHSINEFTSPPLAQSTIDRKGHAKPLIDTAVMLRAVDYEVIDRGA